MGLYRNGTDTFPRDASPTTTATASTNGDTDHRQDVPTEAATTGPVRDGFAAIAEWVPGEAIVAYAGVITALQTADEAQAKLASEVWILALFGVLSFLIVVVSGNLAHRRQNPSGKFPSGKRRELIIRGVLGTLGFFLWSYMIPGSATQSSGFATTYAAAVPVMVPFIAVVYGLLAEFLLMPALAASLNARNAQSEGSVTTSASPRHGSHHPGEPSRQGWVSQEHRSSSSSDQRRPVMSAIDDKYAELGGQAGPLGEPIGPDDAAADQGRRRRCKAGSIVWHPLVGAHAVLGAIHDKWEALGLDTGFLGYPTADTTTAADGAGLCCSFQGGVIYEHPDHGAFEVHGDILGLWSRWEWGLARLGYPISDEQVLADGIGRCSDFQHGIIVWHPNLGACALPADTAQKWRDLDAQKGSLGYPVTSARHETSWRSTRDGDMRSTTGDVTLFEGGAITTSPTTGSSALQGEIFNLWTKLGGTGGALGLFVTVPDFPDRCGDTRRYAHLGYPTGDQAPTAHGDGAWQQFEFGSDIYWSPSTGPHELRGPLLDRWRALGADCGILGLPTSSARWQEDGADYGIVRCHATFERGEILFGPTIGAVEIHGEIHRHWRNAGRAGTFDRRAPIGYPIRDEGKSPEDGRISQFERGWIDWSPTTGTNEEIVRSHTTPPDGTRPITWSGFNYGFNRGNYFYGEDGIHLIEAANVTTDPDAVRICLQSESPVEVWKALRIINHLGDIVCVLEIEGPDHRSVSTAVDVFDLRGAVAIFSKAKFLGLHNDMWWLDVHERAFWSTTVRALTFNWFKD